MPVPTLEQLAKKEAALKKVLAEQGESMDPVKRRTARKKLRRAQRKRRGIVADAARRAGKAKPAAEEKAEAKPAAEAPKAADAPEAKKED